MNLLYFDCMSGISGDMAVGALLDMGIDTNVLARELGKVNLGTVYDIETQKVEKNGILATSFKIYGGKTEDRFYLRQLSQLVIESGLCSSAKQHALNILKTYSNAYACVHGIPEERVLFCGGTVVNIIAASALISMLGADKVISSPLTEGSGFAKTDSGLMRVPVPMVMEILRSSGAPLEICPEETQLVTPTGAAIVCSAAQRFGKMPSMTISATGFGAGLKELDSRANVLRVVLGRNEHGFFGEGLFVTDTDSVGGMRGFLTSCE